MGVGARFMARRHIIHQIVRLSMVPYSFKAVYHLVITEKLANARRSPNVFLSLRYLARRDIRSQAPKFEGYRLKTSQRNQICIDQAGRRHNGSKVKGIRSLIPSP